MRSQLKGKTPLGFIKDLKRMNVALTRAKYALWILGNHESLSQNKDWKYGDESTRYVML